MKNYEVTIYRGKLLEWQRVRHTMPAAVDAAVLAVWQLHDWLSTRDSKAAWIDHDCAKGWNPRTAPMLIQRGDYTLTARRL